MSTLVMENAPDTVLNEVISIGRPVYEVFAYAAEFENCPQWDASAISSEKITAGPTGVGTRYRVVCALPVGRLKLEYEVEEYVQDEKIALLGRCSFFEVRDTIVFKRAVGSCVLEYTAVFTYQGVLGRLAPLLEAGLQRMGRASVQQGLKEALEDDYPAPTLSRENARADRLLPLALTRFTRRGYTRGKPGWNPVSAYMGDKHVVITGATAGLGRASAFALAKLGAALTLVARDAAKGEALLKEIVEETGNTALTLEIADLSLMADVDKLVASLNRGRRAVDVLINNAGALFNPRQETPEGIEKSFALLLLGPYRLTEGIYPLLQQSASSRVVNVVSGGMYSQKLCVDDLQSNQGKYSGSVAYARAKRALMVTTEQWAQQWALDNIVVNAMHPGWAATPGVESALPAFYSLTRPVLRTAAEGADTIVWLAAATEAGKTSGSLFLDREPRSTHLLRATRESDAEREQLADALAQWKVSG